MLVDRRAFGLAAVSVILGALVVASIGGEKAEAVVEVLKNEYPKISGSASNAFTFSVVFRRDIEEVQVRFYAIYHKVVSSQELLEPGKKFNESSALEDVMRNVRAMRWFLDKASSLGLKPQEIEAEVEVDGEPYRLLLHDYSRVVEALCGNETAAIVPTVFGVMMNRSGFPYYLSGVLGFFSSANVTMAGMSICTKGWEARYVPDDQVREGSENLPLSAAPAGVVALSRVKKDDVASIVFSARAGTLPRPQTVPISMLQLIEVYVDGRLYGEPLLNFIKSGGMLT